MNLSIVVFLYLFTYLFRLTEPKLWPGLLVVAILDHKEERFDPDGKKILDLV